MIAISLLLENGFHTFQLMIMSEFRSVRDFQRDYVNEVTSLMDSHQVWHGLVASDREKILTIRGNGGGRDVFVVLNAYESEDQFKKFYYSGK